MDPTAGRISYVVVSLIETPTCGKVGYANIELPATVTAASIGTAYLQTPKNPTSFFVASEGRIKVYAEASLEVSQDAGQVSKINIMSSGVNYLNADDVVVDVIHGDGRTGILAECTPILGAATYYKGRFTTTRGFLSSDKYLQDETMYNDYTYMIRVAESFERYSHLFHHLLHPAGFQMIGRFVSTLDAGADEGGLGSFVIDEEPSVHIHISTAGRISFSEMLTPGFEISSGELGFSEMEIPDTP